MKLLQAQRAGASPDALAQLTLEVASLQQRLEALEALVLLGQPGQQPPTLAQQTQTHSTHSTPTATDLPLKVQVPPAIRTSRECTVNAEESHTAQAPQLAGEPHFLQASQPETSTSTTFTHDTTTQQGSSNTQAATDANKTLITRQPSAGLPGPSYVSPLSAGLGPPAAAGVPMGRTRVVMHQVVLPAETDSLGICFGGQVLSWIDVCAGLSAKTLAKGPCVTATLDAVHFLRPCRRGTVVIIAAMVNRTFNSSMEVGVRVEAEDMHTGQRDHCCSAYLTFVAQRGPPPRASLTGNPAYCQLNVQAASPVSATANAVNHPFGSGTNTTSGMVRSSSCGTAAAGSSVVATTAAGNNSTGAISSMMRTTQAPSGQTPAAGAASTAASAPLLPRVIPSTTEHTREHQEADARRQARLAERQRMRSDPELAAQAELCRLRPITHRDGGPTLPPSITPPWLGCHPLGCTPAISIKQHSPDTASGRARHEDMPAEPQHPSLEPAADGSIFRVGSMSHFASSLLENVGPTSPNGSNAVHMARTRSRFGHGSAFSSGPAGHSTADQGDNDGSLEPRVCVINPSLTVAYMTQSIMPHHANTIGITFGGQVMRWMELCAYISASRLRAPHLLTAAVDSLSFVRPTCVGDILYVTSQVTAIFGSSMEVHVSVHGEDPQVGELFHCADGYITVVAVAACGKKDNTAHSAYAPVKLPFVLEPVTPADMIQAKNALMRRDARLQLRTALSRTYSGLGRGMDKPM